MPADGTSLPAKRGTSARPAGPARSSGYLNHSTWRKGGMTARGPGCVKRPRIGIARRTPPAFAA